ncbi:MAG: hypothetical protein GX081_00235 [Firmicutes bacterium]|nr:hypothetical protein [Bacillota bacterium]
MQKRSGFIVCLVIGLVLAFLLRQSLYLPAKEEKVMDGFKALLAQEDLTVAQVIAYVDKHIKEVSPAKAGQLVLGLEQVQKEKLSAWQRLYEDNTLQQKMAEVYQRNWALEDLTKAEDGTIRRVVEKTVANGYKVETAEGMFFPVIDYTLYRKYYKALAADLSAYFDLMAVESEKAPVKDAALMISWEEVLERAERQKRFIEGYSSSTQVELVRELLARYVAFALFGCNNTPLFSYETKEMDPEAKQAYLAYVTEETTGEFSQLIKDYLQVLNAYDYRLTAEVDAFRQQAVQAWKKSAQPPK